MMVSARRFCLMIAALALCAPAAFAMDYYVSSSSGSDARSGLTVATAWKGFARLNAMTLQPGDQVMLKRGDTWNQTLHLRGKGTAQKLIHLGAYGKGAKPIIQRKSYVLDRCVQIENPCYWTITDLQMQHAKIGLYLRYEKSLGNRSVTVARCDFRDMLDNTANPVLPHNELEIAWSAGVFVGGKVGDKGTVIDGVHVKQCSFTDLGGSGFYSAFFFPRPNRSRLMNVTMEECVATRCGYGIFAATGITNGRIRHIVSREGGGANWYGACSLFLGSSVNVRVEDSEFSSTNRYESGDGEGLDIDGNCEGITVQRCLFRENDAAGLIMLSTEGPSRNVSLVDNVFVGNARGPAHSHDNYELVCGDPKNLAVLRNNRLYKRDGRGYFSDQADGMNHSDKSNRLGQLREVWNLPVSWSSLASWRKQAGWVVSPRSFFGTAMPGYIGITARKKASVKLQWLTETNSSWQPGKPVTATLNLGINWLELRKLGAQGVIRQLRLSGDTAQISSLRQTESKSAVLPIVKAKPLAVRLEIPCVPDQTGHIWEDLAGNGKGGMPSPIGATMLFGDDVSNRASRLILSFDTSVIPEGAQIQSATLMVSRVSNQGDPKSPWITPWQWLPEWGNKCRIDLKQGSFGPSIGLDAVDYQAKPDVLDAGSMIIVWRDGLTGYSQLRAHALPLLNRDGLTQFRMRFTYPSNRNGVPEWMVLASGHYPDTAMRPKLVIEYVAARM